MEGFDNHESLSMLVRQFSSCLVIVCKNFMRRRILWLMVNL